MADAVEYSQKIFRVCFVLLVSNELVCGEPGVLRAYQNKFVKDVNSPLNSPNKPKSNIGDAIYLKEEPDDDGTKYCIEYNSLYGPLPHNVDHQRYSIVDLSAWKACSGEPVPPSLHTAANNLEGSFVIVSRGNCTFTEKAVTVKNRGAVALLITDTTIFVPHANSSEEYKWVNMTVGSVDWASVHDIKNKGYHYGEISGVDTDPDYYNLLTFLTIIAVAVFTVTIGGYWSGKAKYEHYEMLLTMDASERAKHKQLDDVDVQKNVTILIVCVSFVLVNVTLLVLLYFYYDQAVYIVMSLFFIGATIALHHCLTSAMSCLPGGHCQIPANNLPYLRRQPTVIDLLMWPVSLLFVVWYIVERHSGYGWVLLDILGVVFCVSVLYWARMPHFKFLCILLCLLFVYDVFFVFLSPYLTSNGESIMVKVATGGASGHGTASGGSVSHGETREMLPLLFKLPKFGSWTDGIMCNGSATDFSLLGFGDVLVPGFLVSYAHFFDLKVNSMCKVYYISTLISYMLGLSLTFVALLIMDQGQPALLYIVPCVLFTNLVVSVKRREFRHYWHGYVKSPSDKQETQQHDQAHPRDVDGINASISTVSSSPYPHRTDDSDDDDGACSCPHAIDATGDVRGAGDASACEQCRDVGPGGDVDVNVGGGDGGGGGGHLQPSLRHYLCRGERGEDRVTLVNKRE